MLSRLSTTAGLPEGNTLLAHLAGFGMNSVTGVYDIAIAGDLKDIGQAAMATTLAQLSRAARRWAHRADTGGATSRTFEAAHSVRSRTRSGASTRSSSCSPLGVILSRNEDGLDISSVARPKVCRSSTSRMRIL